MNLGIYCYFLKTILEQFIFMLILILFYNQPQMNRYDHVTDQ